MQKISPFLWFDGQALEAAEFYVSVFKNSRITQVMRTTAAGPDPEGEVQVVAFELDGVKVSAMNGGQHLKFNQAVSLMVSCTDQAEVDYFWDALSQGGALEACGWLRDRFGLSWQVTPTVLITMINDPDPVKAGRVMAAMMKMVKLDIATLKRAYAG